jgi:protein-disulfide isomerase
VSRLRAEYIDTGKVRFVYKHFAILGPESNRVAEASECAAEQDQFWAYHDLIFEDQYTSRSSLNEARLVSLAGQIGLDPAAFQECLNSSRYVDRVLRRAGDTGLFDQRPVCLRGAAL